MPTLPPEPLLTPAEMARADRAAPALGAPIALLMAAAGQAVARAAIRRFGPCRTLVLCGPGNNGGDGLAAARLLARRGWPVSVAFTAGPPPGWHASAPPGPVVPANPAEAARAELVIDAAFGAGLSRPLPRDVAACLHAAPRILAVDVPSGLDGETGQPIGDVHAADLTVTFVRRKPGHLLLPGRTLCGELVLASIGMPDAALPAVRLWRNTPALWSLPAPAESAHKYSRGHLTVLGGAAMTGAARLSAEAGRRTGAGMVSIAAQGRADVYRAASPAGLIVVEDGLPALLEDPRRTVWVAGPGLGPDAARTLLPMLLAAGNRQVVADADALGVAAGAPDMLRGAAVLTPHGGEFTRVFGPPGPDKVRAARDAAVRTGAVVVLKGADTVVAAPDGRAAINDNAPPFLATAGAGDVLSGIVGGLLAAGMPPWEAACAAVWLHGRAAILAGPGLLAEDLPAHLPRAMLDAMHFRHPRHVQDEGTER